MIESLHDLQNLVSECSPHLSIGTVVAARKYTAIARLPRAAIGDLCSIERVDGSTVLAEVVSFEEDLIRLAPFDELWGISPGSTVSNSHTGVSITLPANGGLFGSILNGSGQPISTVVKDVHPQSVVQMYLQANPPCPIHRQPICKQLYTGIPMIDLVFPLGYGQRIGLFAGPGAGKSTLLGTIARNAEIDVCVIGLVGERGREVNEFISDSLGEIGLRKSVLIVSTSNESATRRRNAALTATAVAEYYRRQGKQVLLLIDSLTRTARAIREIGLTSGEPAVRHGYTASVFAELPALLERAGTDATGSITGIYTVLSCQENDIDPLAEEVQSLLDGHLVLDSKLAGRGRHPAIDPLQSISRLSGKLQTGTTRKLSECLKKLYSRLANDKDLVLLGGTPDEELESCLEIEQEVDTLLRTECRPENFEERRTTLENVLQKFHLFDD